MRFFFISLLLALSACGSASNSDAPLATWSGDIVWEGWTYEHQNLDPLFDEMVDCVGSAAIETSPPYVIVVSGNAILPNYGECVACWDMVANRIIINQHQDNCTYRHEFIHYLLQQGNEIHDSFLMLYCSYIGGAFSRPVFVKD